MSIDKVQINSSVRVEGIEKIFEERKEEVKVSYEKACSEENCKHLSSFMELEEIKIEKELFRFFGDEQKINTVLRQVMELG
jgi:hypothetical protein